LERRSHPSGRAATMGIAAISSSDSCWLSWIGGAQALRNIPLARQP